jgi:hypothetical protein
MSDDPPVTAYRDVLARRRQLSVLRPLRPPQEFDSLEAYHEAKYAGAGDPPDAAANLDYADLKARR